MSGRGGNRVFGLFFLMSLGLHGLLLGMPESFFHFVQADMPEKEEVLVEIHIEKPAILPRIDIIGEEKKMKEVEAEPEKEPEAEIVEERLPEQVKKESSEEEQIEVLDPADETMFRYQDMIKQRIQSCRKYPRWAKKQGMEGIVYLMFTVISDGSVRDIEIVRSSGFDVLDKRAAATVAEAAPFPSIPEKFNRSDLTMEVDIVFKLR